MDGRRLRKVVGEVDDDAVPDVGADKRSRDAAVVCPGAHCVLSVDLDVGNAGCQIDLHDLRVGIAIVGLWQLELSIPVDRCQRGRFRRLAWPCDDQECEPDQGTSVLPHKEVSIIHSTYGAKVVQVPCDCVEPDDTGREGTLHDSSCAGRALRRDRRCRIERPRVPATLARGRK
jgi:hypothetical protein